jgi:protein gp37
MSEMQAGLRSRARFVVGHPFNPPHLIPLVEAQDLRNDVQRERQNPVLLAIPARIRFICAEPLLEPVRLDLRGISWVIVGGESGPRARHMPVERARDVRDQCRAA